MEFDFKSPKTLPSIKLATSIILTVIFFSVIIVRHYEGIGWLDSFLMVLESMTHAHFGSYPKIMETKLVIAFLTLFGVGVLVYAITIIVEVVVSIDILEALGVRRSMDKKINELHDHVVLCGYGTVGRVVAHELKRNGVSFVIIEKEPETVELLQDKDMLYISGNCKDMEMLARAGIAKAGFLVTALGQDTETLVTILAAKEVNPKIRIVVRVVQEDYAKRMFQIGAERIILPEYVGGKQIAESIIHKQLCKNMSITSYEDLACDINDHNHNADTGS